MKHKSKNIVILLLVTLLSISLVSNIYYKREYDKLVKIYNDQYTLELGEYLSDSFGDIYNSLINLSVFYNKDKYDDYNEEIENQVFLLTHYSSKLLFFLELPKIYDAPNIFELYRSLATFVQSLLYSQETRNYIYENSKAFSEIIQEFIAYSNYTDTEEFKEIINRFKNLTETYYTNEEYRDYKVEVNGEYIKRYGNDN